MTYEKHTTHTDALDTLGSIIGPDEKRDAIHLAVFPAVAGEWIAPGGHVYLKGDVAFTCEQGWREAVGIVDPFLDEDGVREGQRFWLVVYPRQITSLRHVWEHPAFEATPAAEPVSADTTASREWISNWLKSQGISWSVDEVLAALDGEVVSDDPPDDWGYNRLEADGEYIMSYGTDAHSNIPDEFWRHAAEVLGHFPKYKLEYFGCSC